MPSPCSIANEKTPGITTSGYYNGTKLRKGEKKPLLAYRKTRIIYPKMGIAVSRESL